MIGLAYRSNPSRYEEKKNAGGNVFPADMDVIPAFSVVEIMITPANQGGFEQGYGLQVLSLLASAGMILG